MSNVAQYEKHLQLQKTNANSKLTAKPNEEGCSDDDIYTVERIVDKKKVGQKTHYLVKWEGYNSDQNTWEPLQNLKNVRDLLKKFNTGQQQITGEGQEKEVEMTNMSKEGMGSTLVSNIDGI